MRLLRTDTHDLRLETFNDESQIPPYAILSHTWLKDEDEITFAELGHGNLQEKRGWKKLDYSRTQAAEDGLGYIWIDTCCIDRSSSAELTEAINSMFRWYQNSRVCYAYLEDMANVGGNEPTHLLPDLLNCRWFSRGWTLQEMLAPNEVIFYGYTWNRLGSLAALAKQVSEVTKVHVEALTQERSIWSYSVAQRMRWASRRTTTRVQDAAYALLGILDVNLSVIYGEGERAFRRLQEEVLRAHYDQSIFVYNVGSIPLSSEATGDWLGLLAKAPSDFRGSGNVVAFPYSGRSSCRLTGMEVNFELPVLRRTEHETQVALDCGFENDSTRVAVLNVQKYSGVTNTFCCRSGRPKVETIDIFEIPEQCIYTSVSVVLHASRLDTAPSQDCSILICRSRSRLLSFSGVPSSAAEWSCEAEKFDFRKSFSSTESSPCQLRIYQGEELVALASITWHQFPDGRPMVALDGLQVPLPLVRVTRDTPGFAFSMWVGAGAAKWHKWDIISANIYRPQFGPEGRAPWLLLIHETQLRQWLFDAFSLFTSALVQNLEFLVKDTGLILPAALFFRQLEHSWRYSFVYAVGFLLAAHLTRLKSLASLRKPFTLMSSKAYKFSRSQYGYNHTADIALNS